MMQPDAGRDNSTPRQLLPDFYKQYGLDNDGGQNSPYVRIEFSKHFALYFPNFDARRKAVFKHDVHHIATGYRSTFKGETEIGAWEIASGCRRYWVAFVLDMSALMVGLLFNPVGVYKAFVRGRRTLNLYRDDLADEVIMDMPVSMIRDRLLLNKFPGNSWGNVADMILFLLLILFGLLYSILSMLLLPFIIVYSVYVLFNQKTRSSLSD